MFAAARLIRGNRSTGLVQLEGWAAFPNGTFWVLPVAGGLLGVLVSMLNNGRAGLGIAAGLLTVALFLIVVRRRRRVVAERPEPEPVPAAPPRPRTRR